MLLYQPQDGYCYNSDSIFLYDFISSFKPRGRVLDVGSGCGVVGLLVARDNDKIILDAVEKQSVFVELSTINARINSINCNVIQDDFLDFTSKYKYDFIISNPPFYSDGVVQSKNSIIKGARYSSNLPLSDFFKKISQLLAPNSHFIFCYDAASFALVAYELARVKLRVVDVRFVYPKMDRVASLVMIHARNNSKSLMKTHPPLVHFDTDEFSSEVKEIYKRASTQSIKCQI